MSAERRAQWLACFHEHRHGGGIGAMQLMDVLVSDPTSDQHIPVEIWEHPEGEDFLSMYLLTRRMFGMLGNREGR